MTSQDITPSELDEVEDLTMFADESFDTDDVDLFEFTGEDDAPLTLLKSIILSLDWEINDDILQELTDEIGNLQQMWQGDKVAKVYLQGLDKIGSYLGKQGAYAHPNAMKLLLTFFYDFEKIISSHDITGEMITALLKADVRKFKILQYQINQTKGAPTVISPAPDGDQAGQEEEIALDESESMGKEAPVEECEFLTCLKATILGLEWEVTDKGLDQFNTQITDVREHFMENQSAQILIQGLQALGGYITDERANAHPEAFILLHSFYEGLELLLEDKKLSDKERQDILVDRVNRLNNLKSIIAGSTASPSQDVADDIIDEIMEPAEAEQDKVGEETLQFEESPAPDNSEDELTFDFVKEDMPKDESQADWPTPRAAMETADTAYPNEVLDPGAIQPVDIAVADDFIEEELSIGTEIAPALSGAYETTTEEEVPDSEIAEGLDLFFGDDQEDSSEKISIGEAEESEGVEELELSFSDEELTFAPTLGEAEEEGGFSEDATVAALADESTDELDDKLDAFFGSEEEAIAAKDDLLVAPALGEAEEEGGFSEDVTVAALADESTDELDDKLDAFFGSEEEAIAAEDDLLVAPALGAAEEEGGFSEDVTVAALTDESTDELDDKLDAFFGSEEEAIAAEDDLLVAPALGAAEEEGGFSEDVTVAALTDESTDELDDKLDAFFGSEEEAIAAEDDLLVAPALGEAEEEGGFSEDVTVAALADESTDELDDKLDAFFGSEEEAIAAEDDLLVAPALGAAEEEGGFSEDATVAALADESTGELDDKLDAFFGSEEEAETGVEEKEAIAAEDDLLVAPALGAAEEEGGFSEDATVATLTDESTGELDDKLDAFFGPDEETVPTTEEVYEEETAATLTEEAPTASDDKLDNFFVDDEGPLEVQEEFVSQGNAALLALAGGLAALATEPSAQQIEKTQQLVQQIEEEPEKTTEQTVLLQLVKSVLTLIPADSTELPTGTAELTECLFEQLAAEDNTSDTLITAIGRVTDWQKNLMQEILASSKPDNGGTVTAPAVDNIGLVISEVHSGFEALRSTMQEEFTSLREELKQNKG